MSSGNTSLQSKINNLIQEDFRDMEIEYQVMAYLVRVQPAACSMVMPRWFSDMLLRDVFSVVSSTRAIMTKVSLMRSMKDEGLVDDPEIVSQCLDDIFDADITGVNEKGAQILMEQLLSLYESRRVLEWCGKTISNIRAFDLKQAKSALKDLSTTSNILRNNDEGHYLEDYYERVEIITERAQRMHDSEDADAVAGIPTGVYRFDQLCGGLLPGEFAVIGGHTGIGKTSGILNFGLHAWLSGYNTVIVSGEMKKDELQFRIDSYLSRVSGIKFRTAALDDVDFEAWDTTIKQYTVTHSDKVLYTASLNRNFTVDHVESILLRLEEERGEPMQWLGLDYLNIMQPSSSQSSRNSRDWESQANVVWDVKNLTHERGLVTWTGNQIKDEAYELDEWGLEHMKYARSIPEAAPIVVGFMQNEKDRLANRMRMHVLKMRGAGRLDRPIILHPNLDIMVLDVGITTGKKSLTDIGRKSPSVKRQRQHRPYKGGKGK